MSDDERQHMQDELARRDEVIARQSAEIALLKQAVDALTRRIFGAKSESLDPPDRRDSDPLSRTRPRPGVQRLSVEFQHSRRQRARPLAKGRDQGALTRLLGDGSHPSAPASRIIQCDGYSAYPAWSRDKPGITLAGCHAYVRRKFFEAKDQDPKLDGWILRQLGYLYRIEQQLRQARAGPALREAVRAADSRMIHLRLKNFFDLLAKRRSVLPQSLLGKAVRYALNQWNNLVVYLRDGRVEIDTNLVENASRPTKLGAKNWLFIGREAAGDKTAILYTIVENCRRLGIDPRDYLEDALSRLPGMKAAEVASQTPANWIKTRQLATRRAA